MTTTKGHWDLTVEDVVGLLQDSSLMMKKKEQPRNFSS